MALSTCDREGDGEIQAVQVTHGAGYGGGTLLFSSAGSTGATHSRAS
jgi:hypothetical protein